MIEAAITFQDFLLKSWHLLIFRHVLHAGILEISLLTGLITQISDQVHWKFKIYKNCKSETVTHIWRPDRSSAAIGGVKSRILPKRSALDRYRLLDLRTIHARERVHTRFYVVSELFGRFCVGVWQFFEPLRESRFSDFAVHHTFLIER